MEENNQFILKRNFLIFSVFTIFLFSILSVSAALPICWTSDNANECMANDGFVVMHLSGANNAHGELNRSDVTPSYAANNVVCCDFGVGSTSCSADDNGDGYTDNLLLTLSGTSNAHAESPSLESPLYNEEVCSDAIIADTCRTTQGNCAIDVNENGDYDESEDEVNVITLSSAGNAHLGSNYDYNVCCRVDLTLSPPISDCGNGVLDFGEVCDGSLLDGNTCTTFGFSGGTLECNAQCNGFVTTPCEGYLCNNDGTLDVGNESCDGSDLGGFTCGDFDDFDGGELTCDSTCEFDFTQCVNDGDPQLCDLEDAYWSLDEEQPLSVDQLPVFNEEPLDLILEGNNYCGSAVEINFSIYEEDSSTPDDYVTSLIDNFYKTTWVATHQSDGIGGGLPEYYFNASITQNPGEYEMSNLPNLNVSEVTLEEYCTPVDICANYYTSEGLPSAKTSCNIDRCNVANIEHPGADTDADGYDCEWSDSESTCDFVNIYDSDNPNGQGKCIFHYQDTGDVCEDDGFLDVVYTTTWTGTGDGPASCQDGTESYECPAQIPLPFFSFVNILLAGLIIAAIYTRRILKK